ncbi:MAG: hypothetical protein ACETV1_07510, partial [Candidatus Bathyarchaeia archaeon]
MKRWLPKVFFIFALFGLLFFSLTTEVKAVNDQPLSIYGRVVDATTNQPISGAVVLIWDVMNLSDLELGSGLCITDDNGYYSAEGPYIRSTCKYYVYAYAGNPLDGHFTYAPSTRIEVALREKPVNTSFRLVPSATISLVDDFWYVESVTPPHQFCVFVTPASNSSLELYNATYLRKYGFGRYAPDTFFLGLSDRLVIVPAEVKVYLYVSAEFYSSDRGFFEATFIVDNNQEGFILPTGSKTEVSVAWCSLSASFPVVQHYVSNVYSEVQEAHNAGFYVWEERMNLLDTLSSVQEDAYAQLLKNDYVGCWTTLRQARSLAEGVQKSLSFMRLVSSANATYLPAFFAVYAVTLGFFAFENTRRKIISSLCFHCLILASLFWIYPGMQAIASESLPIFL